LPWLKGYSQDDLLELREEVLCRLCHPKVRRQQKQEAMGTVDVIPAELLAALDGATGGASSSSSNSSSSSSSSSSSGGGADAENIDDFDDARRRKMMRVQREIRKLAPYLVTTSTAGAAAAAPVALPTDTAPAADADADANADANAAAAATAQPSSDCSGSTSSEGKNDTESCERTASPAEDGGVAAAEANKGDQFHQPAELGSAAAVAATETGGQVSDCITSAVDDEAMVE
jgi:hypothetical protein